MIITYKNGNYRVMLNLEDGTKIRYNDENTLISSRPESIDVKISNQCEHNCIFCHENSNINGKLASIDAMKNFCNTLPPYCEIAVGGGNLMLSYNHTEVFLNMLKEVEAIPSITIRQDDFIKYKDKIQEWKNKELIYGIGVSLTDSADHKLYRILKEFPTAVVHVIAGILTEEDYEHLRGHHVKLLILGYKQIGRGKKYYHICKHRIRTNMIMLEGNFYRFNQDFDSVSFDNLALEQLYARHHVSKEVWEKSYFGEDGDYTFYIDLVKEQFAKSSTSLKRYDINDLSIQQMFERIKND